MQRSVARWLGSRWSLGLAAVLVVAAAAPAPAVEYRLLVANVQETGFTAYLDRAALARGTGEGTIPRLESALDTGRFPRSVLLYDRPIQPGGGALARTLGPGSVRMAPLGAPETGPATQWIELRWDGQPGERSVWVIAPSRQDYQEAYHVAIGVGGPIRYFIPYSGVTSQPPAAAYALPRAFIVSRSEGGDLWDRHLGAATDLSRGLAVIVGTSEVQMTSDTVYLVVQHAPGPQTFKAVVGWRPRPSADFRIQSPGVER